jgi:hypothetical protein
MTADWSTDDPEVASEVAGRVTGGVLKVIRTFVPTRENEEGHREHWDTPILDGVLYAGTDRALCITVVRFHLEELCKKKSTVLRAALVETQDQLCTSVNYGSASPWLKAHEKNVRSASLGEGGIRLTVVPRLVELFLPLNGAGRTYAEGVRETVSARVLEAARLAGPFPLPDPPLGSDTVTLVLTSNRVRYESALRAAAPGEIQLRLRPGSFPLGLGAMCGAYKDPLGEHIVELAFRAPAFDARLYFRVLAL